MSLDVLDCGNCGARLPPPANTPVVTCEFCNASAVNPIYVPAAPVATPVAVLENAGTDSTLEQWVQSVRGYLQINSSLYYAPHIPPSKEAAAREAYSDLIPADEPFLAQFDGTIFGKGDDGFVITPNYLASYNLDATVIAWRDVDPAMVSIDKHLTVMNATIWFVPDDMREGMKQMILDVAQAARPVAEPAPAEEAPAEEAPPAAVEWFVTIEGEQQGPLTTHALQRMFTQAVVDGENYAWCEGMADWLPAKDIAALAEMLPAPEPEADPDAVSKHAASVKRVGPSKPIATGAKAIPSGLKKS